MKKIGMFSLIIVSLLITGCSETNEIKSEATEFPKYVSKCYISDIDYNGWFKYLCIELSKKNNNVKEVADNYRFDESANYVFDGINLKYKSLDEFYIPVYDENKNEISKVEAPYPSYSVSKKYRDEVKKINKFLNDKKFKNEISLYDLKDLDTKFFSKDELVSMFNYAYTKEPVELGNYIDLPFASIINSISNNGFCFQVGYYSEYGNISKINIEIVYDDGKHLSDLVSKGESSKEQNELYSKINKIEQYIILEQKLDISKSDDYDDSLKLLLNVLKGIVS